MWRNIVHNEESARQQDLQPGINMFDSTMLAVSFSNSVLALSSLLGRPCSISTSAEAKLRKRFSLEDLAHKLGHQVHMVMDCNGFLGLP